MTVQRDSDARPSLFIRDWRAWLPPATAISLDVTAAEHSHILRTDPPAAANVPAMLRRRLSPLGRAICEMLDALDVARDGLPILHASQHGDGQRPLDMLDTIAAGEALSPTRFSLSVHNATLGVYSIASGHRASMAALAAAGAEFDALISETRGYFAEGSDEVAVVLSDSPIPARYRAEAVSSAQPSAIVMILSQRHGRAVHAEPAEEGCDEAVSVTRITPLQLVDWLTGQGTLRTRRPARRWHVLKAAAAGTAGPVASDDP